MFALRSVCLGFACVMLLVAAPDTAQAQPATSDDAFKLRRLNHHFEFIRSEAEFGRKLGGGITLGLGLPFTGLGAYLLTRDCDGGFCAPIGFALLVPGVVLTASGIVILAFPGREETATAQFIKRTPGPDSDPRLLSEAVFDGERLLEDLAMSGRNSRYISGAIYAVLGGLQVSRYFSDRSDPDTQESLSATLTGSGLWFILSIASFAITSDAEDARDAYHNEVKRGLPSATNAPKLRLAPSLMPQGGGLAASLTW